LSNKLLLVGNADATHIGANLLHAAQTLGLQIQFLDIKDAFAGNKWIAKLNWWFRGHRPPCLKRFSSEVVRSCQEFKPNRLLTVGMAPVEAEALQEIGKLGVLRLNYLTDDPWNPVHKAAWFLKALPLYDSVFSVRQSILEGLRSIGCKRVYYLPFAYAPELHYPEPPSTEEEKNRFGSDVTFVGGGDRDRIPYTAALIKNGFRVALYGGYWERFPETKPYARGHADPWMLRKAIGGSKVALCLVRRANRDGNSMRTFEIPAMGTCMLTEDTEEHREIFGEEGKAVVYFRSISEMIEKLKWLLSNENERQRLANAAHELIVNNQHTYKDRLLTMLNSK